jgi:hypothetical protein
MSKWSLVGAWVVVALLASTLTWQIVSAADAQVSDRPAPLVIGAPILTADSSTTTPSAATASGGTTASSLAPSGSATTTAGGSSPDPTPTTTTTEQPTSQPEAEWSVKTIPTGGGVLVVSYRPGEVVLASASPGPGFAAEVKKSGPPEVEVEFESESAKYEVKVKWSSGELAIETDEDTEDDD